MVQDGGKGIPQEEETFALLLLACLSAGLEGGEPHLDLYISMLSAKWPLACSSYRHDMHAEPARHGINSY